MNFAKYFIMIFILTFPSVSFCSGLDISVSLISDYYFIDGTVDMVIHIINNSGDKIRMTGFPVHHSEILLLYENKPIDIIEPFKDSTFQPMPDIINPRVAISQRIDLKTLFEIKNTGKYNLLYKDSILSFDIIPPYNPSKNYTAKLKTDFGNIDIKLLNNIAPETVKNFFILANRRFYDGLTFHRVIEDFIIQGGCPEGDGTGGPGYTIPAELSDRKHNRGTVSMARGRDLNSAGSQFFICVRPQASFDMKYTVFGTVINGMETVDLISGVKTTKHQKEPFDSPLSPVIIHSITIIEGA